MKIMDKNETRDNINYNFLNTIQFTVKFTGMIDLDIQEYIKNVRDYLNEKGYIFMYQTLKYKTIDDDYSNDEGKMQIFKFQSDNNKTIEMCKDEIKIEIDMTRNKTHFGQYIDTISNLINELKKKDYIKLTEIGLKKINTCYFLDDANLSDYFNDNVLSIFDKHSYSSQNRDLFFTDNGIIQYDRSMQVGLITEDNNDFSVKQIILSILASNDHLEYPDENGNERSGKEICKNAIEKLDYLNYEIFNVFYESLTDSFIKKLTSSEFEDKNIRGVRKNDQ